MLYLVAGHDVRGELGGVLERLENLFIGNVQEVGLEQFRVNLGFLDRDLLTSSDGRRGRDVLCKDLRIVGFHGRGKDEFWLVEVAKSTVAFNQGSTGDVKVGIFIFVDRHSRVRRAGLGGRFAAFVVALLVEGSVVPVVLDTAYLLVPVGITCEIVVPDLGNPQVSRSDKDVWIHVPFFVSIGTHHEVGETIANIQWANVALEESNTLSATSTKRAIINIVAMILNL